MSVSRREFLAIAAAAAALAGLGGGAARAATRKVAIPLAKAGKLKAVGGWAVLRIKELEILFVRATEKDVHALSATCTHKQCTVAYDPAGAKVACPCHGSTYDLAGNVLTGPAARPLKDFNASLDGDRVVIELDDAG